MGTVQLHGRLVCRDVDEAALVESHLPRHVELTRAEPGCRRFEVRRSADPLVWTVVEEFGDPDAYDAHQRRVGESQWGRATAAIARRYAIGHDDTWQVLLTDLLTQGPVAAQPGEYAFPGPLRDEIVAAVLSGEKTATSSLVEEYLREGEPLPHRGDLEVVLDSDLVPVCVTATTRVRVERFGEVSDEHARAEGEGFRDAADWREAHRRFWTSPEFIGALGDPRPTLDDDTRVVLVEMEVLTQL